MPYNPFPLGVEEREATSCFIPLYSVLSALGSLLCASLPALGSAL
jgi:hypothetical protein